MSSGKDTMSNHQDTSMHDDSHELTGLARYQVMMLRFSQKYLEPAIDAHRSGEKLERETDTIFSHIFVGHSEIMSTLEAIDLIEALISVSPPRSKKIQKDDYIKFLVGSHLHEIYILEQRLTAYAKIVSRLYKRGNLPSAVKAVVYNPLESIILARGSHVHARRYSDEDLDRVATLALFRRAGHKFGDDLEYEYTWIRWKWARKIKQNNSDIRKILDKYFDLIIPVISKRGIIFLPAHNEQINHRTTSNKRTK